MPLVNTLPRSTALRSLGGLSNCFANESFMDEFALAASADSIAFRKKYVCALSGGSGSPTSVPVSGVDPRGVAALDAMAQQAGWGNPIAPARAGAVSGKGVAFARYETVETYVAVYVEVEVTTATGEVWVRRVVVAHDCGLIISERYKRGRSLMRTAVLQCGTACTACCNRAPSVRYIGSDAGLVTSCVERSTGERRGKRW